MKKSLTIFFGNLLLVSIVSAQTIEGTYAIRNTVTGKNLRPVDAGGQNGKDNSFLIRLKGTELYITTSSDKTNSDIILQEKQSNSLQLWRLVAQNPDM